MVKLFLEVIQIENGKYAKKHALTEKLILDTASGLFIEKKSGSVSFDEIADKAGIARRTIFNYFESKDRLIFECARPILSRGIEILRQIDVKDETRLDDIFDLCLILWKEFGMNLYLLYSLSFEESAALKELHEEYVGLFRKIFGKIHELPEGLKDNIKIVYSLVYKCFVPVLHSLSGIEEFDVKFKKSMGGLINGVV